MRVRPLGFVGLSLAIGASLLQTSIPAGSERPHAARLNFRLEPADVRALQQPAPQPPEVWAVARVLPKGEEGGDSDRRPPTVLPDGIDAVTVTLTVGADDPVMVITNGRTVGELLRAMTVRVRGRDFLKPGPDRSLWEGLRIRLVGIREVVRTEIVETTFQTLIRYSKDLVVGTMRILEEGQVGRAERTYRIRFRNGREVRRELLAERIISEPVSEVVLKGTFEPVVQGGNRQVGQASWYDFCPIWGMYAAHLTIPKGTLVHVRNLDNGKAVDVVINDSGPYGVPGRIIDLCQPAFAAVAPLGQGVADVEITW